jgi:hypothetical protein
MGGEGCPPPLKKGKFGLFYFLLKFYFGFF